MAGLNLGSQPCRCTQPYHSTRLVAVTGGPGGGKTAVLGIALRTFCSHVAVLPEAASMVFGGGFPRVEAQPARRAAQRAIFYVQRELERLALAETGLALALCDRGTVDGLAYWPGDPDAYWRELGTTMEAELGRYHAVIHLEPPGDDEGYNHQNAVRIETASEAHAIDQRIQAAWQAHPRRHVVGRRADFLEKAFEALRLIREEVPTCCFPHGKAS